MIPPALADASTDRRVRGSPREVLLYLHKVLDPGEYRHQKLYTIADAVGVHKSTAGRAMKRLASCGYIRIGPREKPGGRSYLLLTTRGETLKQRSA